MSATRPEPTTIFALPNELLTRIFGYIYEIDEKLRLEQVCARFREISLCSATWRSITTLDLNICCLGRYIEDRLPVTFPFVHDCGIYDEDFDFLDLEERPIRINGRALQLNKIGPAINILLSRIGRLSELSIHVNTRELRQPPTQQFGAAIVTVLNRHASKLKLRRIEVHLGDSNLQQIILCAIQHSAAHVEELVFYREKGIEVADRNAIFQAISHLPKLKSVAMDSCYSAELVVALQGKPLSKFEFCNGSYGLCLPPTMDERQREFIGLLCSNVSGEGVESLGLCTAYFTLDLDALGSRLDDRSRNGLTELRIDDCDTYASYNDYLQFFADRPLVFPRLRTVRLTTKGSHAWWDEGALFSDDLEEHDLFLRDSVILNDALFRSGKQLAEKRTIILTHSIVKSLNTFREQIEQFCTARHGITATIGEEQTDPELLFLHKKFITVKFECCSMSVVLERVYEDN